MWLSGKQELVMRSETHEHKYFMFSYMQNQDLRKTDMDVEESPGRERNSKRGQEKATRSEMIKECHMHMWQYYSEACYLMELIYADKERKIFFQEKKIAEYLNLKLRREFRTWCISVGTFSIRPLYSRDLMGLLFVCMPSAP